MNLKEFNFPNLSAADIAFSTLKTDKTLLAEAEKRLASKTLDRRYERIFNKLFFNGGSLHFKSNLEQSFKEKALPYLKALMSSFEPKHQEKEAICALLLSELVDADKYDV